MGVFKQKTIPISGLKAINYGRNNIYFLKKKKHWKKIDDSVQIDQWIPKMTLVHKDLSLNSFFG